MIAPAVPDADPNEVARAVVQVVQASFGERPLRVHVDQAIDEAVILNIVAD